MEEKLSLASRYGLAESRVANFETLRDIAITKIAFFKVLVQVILRLQLTLKVSN
ncbi:hypothetical protein [Desulfosporosinus sp.]|uniref:hypothetical protein n=1 Tax=Desulfosporosinus sp. TaxID=157907 RepID=UPI002322BDA3|nr:hypothetical protein [Desulfosporosinus sp.]MCO5386826.1 hypothetical protein [Desulfosporosinus sp.]MDA8221683.1 hypothetical protein [Desulfitobacterium hafniense]